jgi:hypothetical protein
MSNERRGKVKTRKNLGIKKKKRGCEKLGIGWK